MTTPQISVIVPIYKAEAYLHRCVDSLLAQTFRDYEILLIDDGSPDGSGAICDAYARQDGRVRVFHKENGGASDARNVGIEYAKGEWITFVDSDDWVEEKMFSTILSYPKTDEVDLIYYSFLLEGDKDQLAYIKSGELAYYFCNTPDTLVKQCYELERKTLFGWTCNKFFRRAIIQVHNIHFNTSISLQEDHLFTLEYVKHASSLMTIPYQPYHYFLQPNSLMRQKHSTLMLEKIALLLFAGRMALLKRSENALYAQYAYESFLTEYTTYLLNGSIDEYRSKRDEILRLQKILKQGTYSKKGKKMLLLYALSLLPACVFVRSLDLIIQMRQRGTL